MNKNIFSIVCKYLDAFSKRTYELQVIYSDTASLLTVIIVYEPNTLEV